MSCLPITLVGDSLGRRHRHLNALVAETYQIGVPFQDVEHLPEKSPVDRLFKIDLASKLRNVDYILRNIKDEDMLYVSRALKAKWILDGEYQCFINPQYLESSLYPYMVTTAVSKIKNWLYLNLKDPHRCADFYGYYSGTNFNYAVKFLVHCSVDFILNETPNILKKLSPFIFKVLCEKCPQVAKIYFDNVLHNDEQRIMFVNNHLKFFNGLKVVLKLDPDMFFEITEKFFDVKYGPSLTKYIITHHRDRFDKKPELYAGRLLNVQSIAKCLTPEECKELVLTLMRAKYIRDSISYSYVEPLINRVSVKEKAAFMKQIYEERAKEKLVETWPYETPTLHAPYETHAFQDEIHPRFDHTKFIKQKRTRLPMKKKKGIGKCCDEFEGHSLECRDLTYRNELLNKYRFVSFEHALIEMQNKIKEEDSSENLQDKMLMLVSKSEGQLEQIASLLQLLEQHSNEPANLRAIVIKSLVKRAAVWRLPQQSWDTMLEFARGLGLDGSTPEVDCQEGLHAVLIKSLLETGEIEPALNNAFWSNFYYLCDYAIYGNERKILQEKIILLVLSAIEAETNSERKAELLTSLLDMLQKYKINIDKSSIISAVASLGKNNAYDAEYLLRRLFREKIGRRTLFHEMFPLTQTDASYLNALRHDTSVLNVSKFVDLIENDEIRSGQFLRKLAIYFAESLGMMEVYQAELQGRVQTNPSIGRSIARPLGLLQGACLSYLQSLHVSKEAIARLAPAIRANMHAGRLKLDMTKVDLPALGAKAIANKVLVCPAVDVDNYINKLLKWKRTVRLAVVLAERIGKEGEVFAAAAALRPTATLKAALKYLRRRNGDSDLRVWEIFKKLINSFDLNTAKHIHIRNSLKTIEKIPSKNKPTYCPIIFKALKKDFYYDAMSILSDIENLVSDVDEDFLIQELLDYFDRFEQAGGEGGHFYEVTRLYLRVLVKFLFLCKSEEIQKKRWEILYEPFDKSLALLKEKDIYLFYGIHSKFLASLHYNRAFFDDNYVSPLPILENIATWMQQYFPIEKHLENYISINLTMSYLNAVRQCIKSHPDVFKNEVRKLSEGISLVGFAFGVNIAQEFRQRTTGNDETASYACTKSYRTAIDHYSNIHFRSHFTKIQLLKAVVLGILQASVGAEAILALDIVGLKCSYFGKADLTELINRMQDVENEKFIYCLNYDLPDMQCYLD